jgi:hypothetical protein
MSERELDPYVEWIVSEAKRPARLDAESRARVLEAVRREPLPQRRSPALRWLLDPRSVAFSRMAGLAAAAGLVGIGVLAGSLLRDSRDGRQAAGTSKMAVAPSQLPVPTDTVRVVKFVFIAPHASQVSLVGDFNKWDTAVTPMEKTPTGGTWTVTLPLNEGRHLYAFVVDGTQWQADPSAPLAPEDGFGAPNSVVLVGGSRS